MEETKFSLPEATPEFPFSIRVSKASSQDNTIFFTILFKTTLSGFGKSINEVERSHGDFLWLYQALKSDESISFSHLPPHPTLPDFGFSSSLVPLVKKDHGDGCLQWCEKRVETNYSSLFQRALTSHEDFLTAISKKESTKDHHCLQMFLTPGTKLASTEGTLNSIMNFASKIYKKIENKIAESGALTSSSDASEEELERIKVFLKGYVKWLHVALEQCERVISCGHLITIDIYNVEQALRDLSSFESLSLPDLYRCFAECIGKNREITENILENQEFLLVDLFRYYFNDSKECLDLLQCRTRLQAKVAKANRNYLNAQSSGKGVIESKVMSESLQKTLTSTTNKIRAELAEQSEERVEIFRDNLLKVCTLGIRGSTARVQNLEKAIGAIEADDFQ